MFLYDLGICAVIPDAERHNCGLCHPHLRSDMRDVLHSPLQTTIHGDQAAPPYHSSAGQTFLLPSGNTGIFYRSFGSDGLPGCPSALRPFLTIRNLSHHQALMLPYGFDIAIIFFFKHMDLSVALRLYSHVLRRNRCRQDLFTAKYRHKSTYLRRFFKICLMP